MDRRVESALTDLARQNPEVEPVARQAWEALTGGSGEARDVSQWWLQVFCWDVLARDASLTPQQRWATAHALGDLLARIGLGRYADLARSETTRGVLLSSDDRGRYQDAYAAALRASGIQPPDTSLLTWGPVMGPAEADTYERVAHALELSSISGDLVAGRAGSAAAREKVADAVLTSPHRESGGLRPLYGISSERLHAWTVRSPTLAALVEPLTEDLTSGVPVPQPATTGALRPLAALLDVVREPAALTPAGYLPPAAVGAVLEAAGLGDEVRGPSRREIDVPEVRLLRDAAQRLGLVRVHRRALTLTPRGRDARGGAAALAGAVAVGWFPPRRGGEAVAREVVTALLAAGRAPEPADAAALVHEVMLEEGWRIGEAPVPLPAAETVSWHSWRDVRAVGLASPRARERVWRVRRDAVPVLRAALRHHLLHHGLSPIP